MGHIATPECIELFKDYPPYSQEKVKDPLVIAKLFDNSGSATWFLTEYNTEHKVAFGYVVGMMQDELGYVSIEELEDIKHPSFGIPRIEQDLYFTQKPLSQTLNEYRKQIGG